MSRKIQYILVGLACVLFLAQALPFLTHRWVEDESWQCVPAYALVTQGRIVNTAFPETDHEGKVVVKPPGHVLVLAPVFKLFGCGAPQARSVSVLVGLGLIVVTFLLGRELAGAGVGVVGAFLLATDNLLFLTGRSARPEVFVALLSTLALLLYFASRRTASVWLSALSGLSAGAAVCFHHTGIGGAAAVAVLLLLEFKLSVWRRPRAWACALGVAVVVLPFVLWVFSTPIHRAAAQFMYVDFPRNVAAQFSLLEKIHSELYWRWGRFLQFPYRVHILVLIVAGFVVLALRNRPLLAALAPAVLMNLAWFFRAYNKSPRYVVVLIPLFALAVSAAAYAVAQKRGWRRVAVIGCLLYGLTQVAGNAVFLYKFRHADYVAVGRELRQLIPQGESVYGAITFWMALHDRTYQAYERTSFEYAIEKRRPSYLILNDRVMVKGMGFGLDDWAELRTKANAFAREHGELVGRVSNPFYGDLEIYRINYNPAGNP